MENPIVYVNERIYKEILESAKALARDKTDCLLTHPRLDPVICEEIISLEENTPEEKLYNSLAELIVTSTNPFAITDQYCLKKTILAYQHLNSLIKEKEVLVLANYHLDAAQDNLNRLEQIALGKRLNEKFRL